MLFDTSKTSDVTVTNTSKVPVKYRWEVPVVQRERSTSRADRASVADAASAGTVAAAAASAGAPFDITPINGMLQPGESDVARVTYFAHAGSAVATAATLHVRGGPAASLQLAAAPNSLTFTLEPRDVNFGTCLYTESVTKTLTLTNPSKCALFLAPAMLKRHAK